LLAQRNDLGQAHKATSGRRRRGGRILPTRRRLDLCLNGPQGYSTNGLYYLYPCHIVILMTFVCFLYSINCPTVICLPSMLFILWRDTSSKLWIPVHSFIFLLPFTIYLHYLHSHKLLSFTTRYV
jgi:hypothetical protein